MGVNFCESRDVFFGGRGVVGSSRYFLVLIFATIRSSLSLEIRYTPLPGFPVSNGVRPDPKLNILKQCSDTNENMKISLFRFNFL